MMQYDMSSPKIHIESGPKLNKLNQNSKLNERPYRNNTHFSFIGNPLPFKI